MQNYDTKKEMCYGGDDPMFTEYTLAGLRHRTDGPAVEYEDNINLWYLNGLVHREGGPAKTWNDGTWEYWHHGQIHRFDGPAIHNGIGEFKEYIWRIYGNVIDEEKYTEWLIEHHIDINNMTEDDKTLIMMVWGK